MRCLLFLLFASLACAQVEFDAWRGTAIGDWASYRVSDGEREEVWNLTVKEVVDDSLLVMIETPTATSHTWVGFGSSARGVREDVDGEPRWVLRDSAEVALTDGYRKIRSEALFAEDAPVSGLVALTREVEVAIGEAVARRTFTVELLSGGTKPVALAVTLGPASDASLEAGRVLVPGKLQARLNRVAESDVSLQVWSGRPALFAVPETVTLPAGQTTVEIPVAAAGAEVERDDRVGRILVSGAGMAADAEVVLPAPPVVAPLTLSLDPPGPLTLPADLTVRLNRPAEQDLALTVFTGRPALVEAPASLTVPAGETEAVLRLVQADGRFPGPDDRAAELLVSGGGSLARARLELAVEELPPPLAGTIAADESATLEDGLPLLPAIVTFSLNRPAEEDLELRIHAGRPDLIDVEQRFILLAGKTSYTFKLRQNEDVPVATAERRAIVMVEGPGLSATLTVLAVADDAAAPEPAPPQDPPADTTGQP